MKRTTKYVGLDVHQATTVIAVLDERGRVLARTVVPTDAEALGEFFRGMRGTVRVAFEEGTQAQWLHDLLHPVVTEVVVCNRRGNVQQGNKGDHADAEQLADRLRWGGARRTWKWASCCISVVNRSSIASSARTVSSATEQKIATRNDYQFPPHPTSDSRVCYPPYD